MFFVFVVVFGKELINITISGQYFSAFQLNHYIDAIVIIGMMKTEYMLFQTTISLKFCLT